MKAIVTVALLLGLCGSASAQPNEKFNILGAGTSSCGTWRADRAVPDSAGAMVDESWLTGYLTGFNRWTRGNEHNITGATDYQGEMAAMDDYCRLHPLDTIEDAAEALIVILITQKS